ncbi:MAG: hypothetical protein MUC84_01025 [Solirubrobacteraceae bacterium]|jgi:hypothetical protein|nr:hypothetical protein [Solirubrobacteraceae bacterium]
MSQQHARAWWSEVEHLREELEERRGTEAPARPALRLVPGPPADSAAPDAPRRAARRTVQITGRPAETPVARRLVEVERRRPAAPVAERFSARPDRLAAWAVLLGLVLVLVALTSG